MMVTWILVAHGSAGKILEVRKNGEKISIVKEFSHPKTAKKDNEVHGDRPDRNLQHTGPLHHAIDYSEEIGAHERLVFAKEIAAFIGNSFLQHHFNSLILVASTKMLGELRKALPHQVMNIVLHQLAKDLLPQGLSDSELVETIRKDLELVHL